MADNVAKYKKYFTKDRLIGPIFFSLFDEMKKDKTKYKRYSSFAEILTEA